MVSVNHVSNIITPTELAAKATAVSEPNAFSNVMQSKVKAPQSLDDIFERAAAKYGVPANLLKAVGKAESGFNPKAVSHAGAQGVMQLMPATARELGVTDSFDPEQNIMGGAKYLRDMLNRFNGDAKLALAAYNAGANNVVKYGGVPPFKETQNYVVKVMEYAGSPESLNVPQSKLNHYGQKQSTSTYPVYNSTQDDTYYNVLKSLEEFQSYTKDDYLLFLEQLKLNLRPSAMTSFGNGFLESQALF